MTHLQAHYSQPPSSVLAGWLLGILVGWDQTGDWETEQENSGAECQGEQRDEGLKQEAQRMRVAKSCPAERFQGCRTWLWLALQPAAAGERGEGVSPSTRLRCHICDLAHTSRSLPSGPFSASQAGHRPGPHPWATWLQRPEQGCQQAMPGPGVEQGRERGHSRSVS